MQHDALLALERKAAFAIAFRGHTDIGQIKARLAFLMRESQRCRTRNNRRHQPCPHRGRCRMPQQTAAKHHRRHVRLQRQRPPDRFADDHHLDRPLAEPTVGFRKRDRQQPLVGELLPERGAIALRLFRHGLPRLQIGIAPVGQAIDTVFQQPLIVGEIKIHGRPQVVRKIHNGGQTHGSDPNASRLTSRAPGQSARSYKRRASSRRHPPA